AVRFVDGLLEESIRQRLEHTVRLSPRTQEKRLVVVDLPRASGYEVASPAVAPLLTPNSWRFGVLVNAGSDVGSPAGGDASAGAGPRQADDVPVQLECAPGTEACELEVVLERVTAQRMAVVNVDAGRIALYLENVELDQATRRLLSDILALKREISQLSLDVTRHGATVTE